MTLTLRVDPSADEAPYEQIRRQLLDHIASGALDGGSRLPPVRQLAGDLGVAVGTVARAYRELEAEGLLHTRRGAGTTVAPGASARAQLVLGHADLSPLEARIMRLVDEARRDGATDDGIRAAVERVLGRH